MTIMHDLNLIYIKLNAVKTAPEYFYDVILSKSKGGDA